MSTASLRRSGMVMGRLRRTWQRSQIALAGGLLLLLIGGAIAGAPTLAHHDPDRQDAAARLQPPSQAYWFGTDRYGRDLFARVLFGGRTTLVASGVALTLVIAIGLTSGIVAGYLGGWLDRALMWLVDLLLAFPSTVLALVIVGLFGAGLSNVLIALVGVWWVSFARVARSIALQARNEPAVAAARALGARHRTIIAREILPRTAGPVLALATLELGHLILAIASLSFLGLGAQPPSAEWGAMLADGRAYMLRAPHVIVAPALAMFVTVLALNLLGEGLRDLLDPTSAPDVEG